MMPPYSHVAVIGVDGAGAFFKDADMPVLSGILAEGAVTYRALTSNPTISAQSWGSLLTGVTPEFHRLSNSLISERPYPSDSLFPTVFHVIRNVMPEAVMGSFCTWNPINIGIVDDGLEITKGTADSDNALCSRICAYVKEERPTFLFVQFDEVDSTGHSYGYGSAQHLKRLSVTDGYIAKIVETYTELGMLEDTLSGCEDDVELLAVYRQDPFARFERKQRDFDDTAIFPLTRYIQRSGGGHVPEGTRRPLAGKRAEELDRIPLAGKQHFADRRRPAHIPVDLEDARRMQVEQRKLPPGGPPGDADPVHRHR